MKYRIKTRLLLSAPAAVFIFANIITSAANAQASVSYTSPIADYQTFVDEKISSWKAANDKVGQIGGWRAYAKEAQQPDTMPNVPNIPAKPSSPNSPNSPNTSQITAPVKAAPHRGHKQ